MSESARSTQAPESDLDIYSPNYLENPSPFYRAARALGPMVRLSRYGVWAVWNYADVTEVLRDAATYCSSGGASIRNYFKEKPWRTPSLLLEADPPLHTRTRAVLTRILSPAAIARLKEAFTQEADKLAERLVAQGSFDAVRDVGEVYPIKVFPDALGLAEEGRDKLLAYGSMVVSGFGPGLPGDQRGAFSQDEIQAYVERKCRRDELAPGGFGARVYDAVDSGELAPEEAPLLVRSFLSAGLDTSIRGLSQALHCLATHPKQCQLLLDNPALARAAFEEMLRYNSPAQTLWRTTTREVTLHGVVIPQHEKLMVSLGAANRDPARWEDPDRYDMTRKTVGHVGLGAGIHGCVGQAIARMEGEAVLGAFARRISALELDGQPEHGQGIHRRGFARLPLKVRPR